MISLERIANVRELVSQQFVVPTKWSLEVLDAAEAWVKLVVVVEKMDWVELSMRESAVVALANNRLGGDLDALEHVGEAATPEAAVAALYDKIGANEQMEKRDGN